MVKKTTVAPASRFLGMRLPLAMFEELRRAGEKEGKLVSEYVRDRINRVGELEKRIKQLEEDIEKERGIRVFPCKVCRKPILASKENILEAFADFGHQACLE